MANTTNFGWETPDDTDLVKDGALAMRTLGNAIDTSLVDLKGGTTGQVLSKNTNTDMDFTWVTPNDADAIQNSIVDAKGDLISASAADTPARLASSGVNGDVLTVDTSTSTGLKWAAPAGGSTFSGCSAFNGSNLTIANNTWTAVQLNSEHFDTDGFHSTTTNNTRFTVPAGKGGYYLLTGNMAWQTNATGLRIIRIQKNGSIIYYGPHVVPSATAYIGNQIALTLAGAVGDYFEFAIYQSSGGNLDTTGGTTDAAYQVTYLGA